MKGDSSVTIRVTDEKILETAVKGSFSDPISEERDGDCMGSSDLRLFDRVLRNWSQAARMRMSKRIAPTTPPIIAAVGV